MINDPKKVSKLDRVDTASMVTSPGMCNLSGAGIAAHATGRDEYGLEVSAKEVWNGYIKITGNYRENQ